MVVLLITGHQRSGTTLLMRLCNSHPEIRITGEFGNFYVLDVDFATYVRFILKRWWQKRNASFLFERKGSIKGVNMVQNLGFVMSYLGQIARNRQGSVGAETIEKALYGMYPHASLVGDKYPDYAFRLKMLTQSPPIHCLFIYRDPRDVASSSVQRARTDWQDAWPAELRQPGNIARRWVQFVELVEKYSTRVYTVKYEELVTQPLATLEGIGRWIGVDPGRFRSDIVKVDRVGKHVSSLTEEEIESVLAIAGPAMQRMGYTL